jgi:hypothetical protein
MRGLLYQTNTQVQYELEEFIIGKGFQSRREKYALLDTMCISLFMLNFLLPFPFFMKTYEEPFEALT